MLGQKIFPVAGERIDVQDSLGGPVRRLEEELCRPLGCYMLIEICPYSHKVSIRLQESGAGEGWGKKVNKQNRIFNPPEGVVRTLQVPVNGRIIHQPTHNGVKQRARKRILVDNGVFGLFDDGTPQVLDQELFAEIDAMEGCTLDDLLPGQELCPGRGTMTPDRTRLFVLVDECADVFPGALALGAGEGYVCEDLGALMDDLRGGEGVVVLLGALVHEDVALVVDGEGGQEGPEGCLGGSHGLDFERRLALCYGRDVCRGRGR